MQDNPKNQPGNFNGGSPSHVTEFELFYKEERSERSALQLPTQGGSTNDHLSD